MKNKLSSAPRIAFALLVLVTLACVASAQAVATESVESPTAESVATEAPATLPDMSIARIFRQQLPGGFEEISTDGFLDGVAAPGEEEYLSEVIFAYVHPDDFQLIFGMNFLLVDTMNRIGFGAALEDPDTLREFTDALGGQNIRDAMVLETLNDLGEERSAMTMLADVEGMPMRVNAVMFQRDIIGGILVSMTREGEDAKISFEKLGKLFDQRVQESLESAQ